MAHLRTGRFFTMNAEKRRRPDACGRSQDAGSKEKNKRQDAGCRGQKGGIHLNGMQHAAVHDIPALKLCSPECNMHP